MRGLQWLRCMLCVCVLLLTTGIWCECSQQYQVIVTDLRWFDDINNDGTAVGYDYVWRDGVATRVAAPESGAMFGCEAINNSGQVVGSKLTFDPVTGRQKFTPFLWQDGVFSLLDVNSQLSARFVQAVDINDSGQILLDVGDASSGIYFDGQFTPVPMGVTAMNNYGEVVGYSGFDGKIWKDGAVSYLPPLPYGLSCCGVDVNDSGQVIGYGIAQTPDEHCGYDHAFIWQDGSMIQMGYLPGMRDMYPQKINKYGVVVGRASSVLPFGDCALIIRDRARFGLNTI